MEIEGAAQGVIATGSRTLYIAGQTSQNATGEVVGAGDFRAQCDQVFENFDRVLAAAGATVADIAKTTIYIVDYDEEKLTQFYEALYEHYGSTPPKSAGSLIGVDRLYMPELLIEMDAVAVLE
jgi:enamine deaminase RidA (YjgF/YER057c/UK114 family)